MELDTTSLLQAFFTGFLAVAGSVPWWCWILLVALVILGAVAGPQKRRRRR
jgi:uncharacterized membrane protein YfcA